MVSDGLNWLPLNNVNDRNNNDDDGIELWNDFDPTSDGAVNVFNSNFNGNGATAVDGLGLEISSYGTVTLNWTSAPATTRGVATRTLAHLSITLVLATTRR